eukprot:4320165-Pleurochrysis_carterae.AAC.1
MVRELERVEREQREKDRAELASLRTQVAALAVSNERHSPTTQPQAHASADGHRAPSNRAINWATISILLNVTALCAAIAVGTMQLLDN